LIYGSSLTDLQNQPPAYNADLIVGQMPTSLIEIDLENCRNWIKEDVTLQTLLNSAKNSYKMFYKTRGKASKESYSRAKEVARATIGIHPILRDHLDTTELQRESMLSEISKFRPPEVTIFTPTLSRSFLIITMLYDRLYLKLEEKATRRPKPFCCKNAECNLVVLFSRTRQWRRK
jgi:hypothetical protein